MGIRLFWIFWHKNPIIIHNRFSLHFNLTNKTHLYNFKTNL